MKSLNIVLLFALLIGKAYAAKEKAAAPPSSRLATSSDQELLKQQVPATFEECDPDSISVNAINLREKLPERDDLIASCDADCGRGGCPYQIFLFRDGRYRQAAEFFGFFELKTSRHQGFADISVKSSLGVDFQSNELLKFNGKTYE